MDRAYEDDETRQLALNLGLEPVVPPKANRVIKWDYGRATFYVATRWSGISAGSKPTVASSHASKSST